MNTVLNIFGHTSPKSTHKLIIALVEANGTGTYKLVRATLPMPAPEDYPPREVSVSAPYRDTEEGYVEYGRIKKELAKERYKNTGLLSLQDLYFRQWLSALDVGGTPPSVETLPITFGATKRQAFI